MNTLILRLGFLISILALSATVKAQVSTPVATDSPMALKKEKLDIQRLQLENEKLKLEVEKMKLSATAVPAPVTVSSTSGEESGADKKIALMKFENDYSDKAKALAKAHASEGGLVVLDFVNAEIWFKGIRYEIYELPAMASEQKLKMSKSLDERLANGVPRWKYQISNLSLLKYESRDKGILEITAPHAPGDFRVLTPNGVSFGADLGDLRNACVNPYFKYDSVGKSNGYEALRYVHDGGLGFSDKLEFLLNQDGKLQDIRFGTLDEH